LFHLLHHLGGDAAVVGLGSDFAAFFLGHGTAYGEECGEGDNDYPVCHVVMFCGE
jgi:hypothetical protein